MRRDPLPAITLLGLVGCALLATLHPTEAFRPDAGIAQAGRTVAVELEVLSVRGSTEWASGRGAPAHLADPTFEWTWFRPPDPPPLIGDRIIGRAQVEREADGVSLVLDGPDAALVRPGPHPIPVRWAELVERPEQYLGRVLTLHGAVSGDRLIGPSGHSCALAAATAPRPPGPHLVRLERTPDGPGWSCRLEGP